MQLPSFARPWTAEGGCPYATLDGPEAGHHTINLHTKVIPFLDHGH